MADAKRHTAAIDRCPFCFASAKRNKELTLSIGHRAYMALPPRGNLAEGHVVIYPTDHVPSFRMADEDVFEELKNFRKCLIQMFSKQVCRPCLSLFLSEMQGAHGQLSGGRCRSKGVSCTAGQEVYFCRDSDACSRHAHARIR